MEGLKQSRFFPESEPRRDSQAVLPSARKNGHLGKIPLPGNYRMGKVIQKGSHFPAIPGKATPDKPNR
jgi:hypothetical protein